MKYKCQNENDIITAKEKIKQKVQVKEQKCRRFRKRTKFYRQNKIFKNDGNWETTHRNKGASFYKKSLKILEKNMKQ